VSDPPLKQVVASHPYEVGLRSNFALDGGKLDLESCTFRTNSSDDIINVASTVQGRGFFRMFPHPRQGVEASVQYKSDQWLRLRRLQLIDATYQFTGDLPSPNNPMADDEGNIRVTPGKRIPLIPLNQGKLGIDFSPTLEWTIG